MCIVLEQLTQKITDPSSQEKRVERQKHDPDESDVDQRGSVVVGRRGTGSTRPRTPLPPASPAEDEAAARRLVDGGEGRGESRRVEAFQEETGG